MVQSGRRIGNTPTASFIANVKSQLDEFAAMLELYEKVKKSSDVELMRRMAEDFHGRGDGARAAALYEAMIAEVQGGGGAAWLHYLSADAYRLGGEYSRAQSSPRGSRASGSRPALCTPRARRARPRVHQLR